MAHRGKLLAALLACVALAGIVPARGQTTTSTTKPSGDKNGPFDDNNPPQPPVSASGMSLLRDDDAWVTRRTPDAIVTSSAHQNADLKGGTETPPFSSIPFCSATVVQHCADKRLSARLPQASGRFTNSNADQVLSIVPQVDTGDSAYWSVSQLGQEAGRQAGYPPAPVVAPPPWRSETQSKAGWDPVNIQSALAAGDADQVLDANGRSNDEAVVAYPTVREHQQPDHAVELVVLDYHTKPGQVVATHGFIPFSTGADERGFKGGVQVGVGDFDGDGRTEIAVAFDNALHGNALYQLMFFRYSTDTGTPTLTAVKGADDPPRVPAQLPSDLRPDIDAPFLQMAIGNFDNDGGDDIAVVQRTLRGGIVLSAFNVDRSLNVKDFGFIRKDSPALPDFNYATRADSAPVIASGLFRFDVAHGFPMGRRELAIGYPLPEHQRQVDASVATLSVDKGSYACGLPKNCTLKLSTLASDTISAQGDNPSAWLPRLSLAAGNFRGLAPDNSIRTDSLAIYYGHASRPDRNFVNWYSTGGSTLPVARYDTLNDLTVVQPTAYDRNGRSLRLGTPVRYTVQGTPTMKSIIEEPPKHLDWLCPERRVKPGAGECYDDPPAEIKKGFNNVNRGGNYTVAVTTSETNQYTTKTQTGFDWGIGGSIEAGASFTGKASAWLAKSSVKADVTAGLGYHHDETTSGYNSGGFTKGLTVSSETLDDDLVTYTSQNVWLYRYPILSPPALDKDGKPLVGPDGKPIATAFYEMMIPGKPTEVGPIGGKSEGAANYQPEHENGNLLSYPNFPVYAAPTDKTQSPGACRPGTSQPPGGCPKDLGPYTLPSPSDPTKQVSFLEALSDTPAYGVDPNSSNRTMTITRYQGSGGSHTAKNQLKENFEAQVSGQAETSIGVVQGTATGCVDLKLDSQQTWNEMAMQDQVTSSANTFNIHMQRATASPSQAYQVQTTYYDTNNGVERVVHGTNVPSSSGQQWWKEMYGGRPDLALNLPQRMIVRDGPAFEDTDARQLVNGYAIRHATDPKNPATSEALYGGNPIDGDKVKLSVRVSNYSLDTAAGPFDVRFEKVETDSHHKVVSPPVPIGTASVGGLAPRETKTAGIDWDTNGAGPPGGGTRYYRIFATVDPDNRIPNEIHELQDRYNSPPTADGKKGGSRLTDPRTDQPEALEMGTNNQGYFEVPVDSKVHEGLRKDPGCKAVKAGALPTDNTPTRLSVGDTALQARGPGLQFDDRTLATPVGKTVELRLHVKADTTVLGGHQVVFYDGDPDKGGKAIATSTVATLTPTGAPAFAYWQPTSEGSHQIYARVDPQPGETGDTVDVISVDVGPPDKKPIVETKTSSSSDWLPWVLVAAGVVVVGGVVTGVVLRRRRLS